MGPINPVSSQGNRYILTLSDYFTKFVEAIPLPDKSAIGVAEALFKVLYFIIINLYTISDFYANGNTATINDRQWKGI